jgi:hypothetical protein
VKIPWKNLAESQEQYCLRYESKHLCVLGDAIEYFISGAVSMATQEALKYTVLSGRQKYKYQVWGEFLIFVLVSLEKEVFLKQYILTGNGQASI